MDKQETKAEVWSTANSWPVANYDIGPLFLAKALSLVQERGNVAMIQPASTWLYQRAGEARKLRNRLFSSYSVDEITNLTAIRRELFAGAIGPACVIVVGRHKATDDAEITYLVPKPAKGAVAGTGFTIDPHDVSRIFLSEAINDPTVWSVLALGGRRDLRLVRTLSELPTLAKLEADGKVMTRKGVIPGDQGKSLPNLRGRRYFDGRQFPPDVALAFDISRVPFWEKPRVHSKDSTDFEAFKLPQLLIKQAYSTRAKRFRAARILSDDPEWGVICNQTYLSVRDLSPDSSHIRAACLVYNSLLAVYYLALTSSRFPFYKNELAAKELMNVPLPNSAPAQSNGDLHSADDSTAKLFALTQADWTIVEELLEFTLPDALRKSPGIGRNATRRTTTEPDLSAYITVMFRVLKSTFGKEKTPSATVYQEPSGRLLPVRMVTLHFDWPGRDPFSIETITADGLLDLLNQCIRKTQKPATGVQNGDGFGFQRVAYLFHSHQTEHGRIRNLTIVKPDERRYWTRSLAMRDADDLAGAILKAAGWKGGSK